MVVWGGVMPFWGAHPEIGLINYWIDYKKLGFYTTINYDASINKERWSSIIIICGHDIDWVIAMDMRHNPIPYTIELANLQATTFDLKIIMIWGTQKVIIKSDSQAVYMA